MYFRPPETILQDWIYKSQLSLIICVVDDFFWTAYFYEDTYYTGQDTVDEFIKQGLDCLSAGQERYNWITYDLRYYFLTVLSIRMY